MIDNSDFKQKIKVRQKGLVLLPTPQKIVDMYCGEGNISRHLWSKFNCDLTCIDKDGLKISKIDFDCKKVVGDNRNHISITKDADIVDLDAYGLVMKILKDVLKISETKEKLIFFTESNPFKKSIYGIIKELLELDITAFWIEKCNSSSIYYGYVYKRRF